MQGTLLILTGVSLHVIPLGMLLRMPSYNHGKHHGNKQQEPDNDSGELESLVANKPSPNNDDNMKSIENHCRPESYDELTEQQSNGYKGSKLAAFLYVLGLDLFKDKYFSVLVVVYLLILLPHHIVPTLMPDHIVWTGGSKAQATTTLVVIGIANTCSRLFVWNLSKENVLLWMDILAISSLVSGASLACTVLYTDYWMYIALCILFGLTRGIFVIYHSLLLIHIVGAGRSHHGFGVQLTAAGIMLLLGMPASGALAEATRHQWGYVIVFIVVGVCEIIAGLICILMRIRYHIHCKD